MRRLASVITLALLTAAGGAAQSPAAAVTGTWAGTLTFKHGVESYDEPLRATLKVDGTDLAGTAGPDADNQLPIRRGKVTPAGNVTSLGFAVNLNSRPTTFDLKLIDGRLKGDAKIEEEDGREVAATVELKPVR